MINGARPDRGEEAGPPVDSKNQFGRMGKIKNHPVKVIKGVMTRPIDILLVLLRHSTHNVRIIAQTFAHTITTGLINNTFTWNSLIRAYSKSSTPIKATIIYNYFVKASSIPPDNYTYPPLLQACTRLSSLPKGQELHAHITKIGLLDSNIYIQNSLIHMYGSMEKSKDARQLFDEMPQRDLVSWNSVLVSYSTSSPDLRLEALLLFKEMMFRGVGADAITLVIMLSACAQVGGRAYGRAIHGYIIKVGIGRSLNLKNALLGIYCKSGDMGMAFGLFREMVGQRDAVSHTILINGYVELGLVDQARMIFDKMAVKDIITWNSMINGYVKVKQFKEALELFEKMELDLVSPDETTIVSVLLACAGISDLKLGRSLHWFILQRNIKLGVFLGTALIDMYAKCGSLEESMITFYKMDYRDVFTWTAVITGLADYGRGKEALILFKQMEREGVRPNEATFVAVFMACSRSGMVEEGCLLFDRMVEFYTIQPMIKHYGCVIDLLSRAGLLSKADKFIKTMLPGERLVAYKTLLSASISYSDIDLGEKIARELIKLRPQSLGVYILLSNFYALSGQWDKVVEMRGTMKKLDIKKEAGISSIEIRPFSVGKLDLGPQA